VGLSNNPADKGKALPDVGRQARAALLLVLGGFLLALILALAGLLLWLRPGGMLAEAGSSLFGRQLQAPIMPAISGAVAAASLLVLLFWRWRAKQKAVFRSDAGCPSCHNHDLIRIRRRQLDRPIGKLVALPLQRYACRSCTWQGLLIGSDRHGFSSDLTAAALLEADAAVWLRPTPKLQPPAEKVMSPPAATAVPALIRNVESDASPPQIAEAPPAAVASPPPPQAQPKPPVTATAVSQTAAPITSEPSPAAAPAPSLPTLKIRALDGHAAGINPLEPLPGATADLAPPAPQPAVVEQEPAAPPATNRPSPDAGDTGSSNRAIVVAPFGLKLRAEPNTDSALLKVLPPDTVVTLLGQADNGEATTWRKISFGGMTGWASAAFLRRLPELPPRP
jgi:hypothetical protein